MVTESTCGGATASAFLNQREGVDFAMNIIKISRHAKVAAPVPCVIYGSFNATDVILRTANAATTANTAFAANRGEVEINPGYIGHVLSYFGLEMSGLLSASGATFLHY